VRPDTWIIFDVSQTMLRSSSGSIVERTISTLDDSDQGSAAAGMPIWLHLEPLSS
jgi:hypothetical protein